MFIISYNVLGNAFSLRTINNGVAEALFEANQIAAERLAGSINAEALGELLLYDKFVEKIEILMPDM